MKTHTQTAVASEPALLIYRETNMPEDEILKYWEKAATPLTPNKLKKLATPPRTSVTKHLFYFSNFQMTRCALVMPSSPLFLTTA